jgi:transposase
MDHRVLVNGVLWRTRAGAPWRDLPEQYGNWKTVYNRFRRWTLDGTWQEALSRLQTGTDGDGEGEWVVGADSTVARAHQHAAGAPHAVARDDPDHPGIGLQPGPGHGAEDGVAGAAVLTGG